MDELEGFVKSISDKYSDGYNFTIDKARNVVIEINNFLFTHDDSIGLADNNEKFFSRFHKYWEENHKKNKT